jgi:regulator of protease activity HflC (stomatin/prohibitin superfamily)
MPGTFILAIITAVIALILAVAWRIARSAAKEAEAGSRRIGADEIHPDSARAVFKGVTLGFAALTALLVLISSYNPVSTQNIGIVTSFGRPVSHLSAGLNFTAPWQSVTEMDEAIQVTDFDASACQIQLRIADQQTACAKVAVRWRINPSAADALFRNYHNSTAGVENGLLIPELQNVANQVFAGYDPVALLDSTVQPGQPGNPTVPQLAQQVQAALTAKVGSEVEIISLFMPNIAYNDTVQARLNAVLSQKASTLVAQQSEQTASAQARANNDISASVSHDPGVLESRCLDILAEMVKAGQSVPAGFSCFPGGSGTGVIANATK